MTPDLLGRSSGPRPTSSRLLEAAGRGTVVRCPVCCRPPSAAAPTVGPPPPWPTAAASKPTPWASPAPPEQGKSTLVDRLIAVARAAGVDQLAVLAVDPTSPFSGGAILGDRVRMQGHDLDPGVFIRSMASRGHLGGLAVAVPEAIRLFAAAGTPLVLVETVGVGQVEVEVASATDTTVVVVNPKWGDAIQANKAGLMETADIFVVNKADMPGAAQSRRDLEQMLDLSTPGDWRPPILETVAATGEGVEALWAEIGRHRAFLAEAGLLEWPITAFTLRRRWSELSSW